MVYPEFQDHHEVTCTNTTNRLSKVGEATSKLTDVTGDLIDLRLAYNL